MTAAKKRAAKAPGGKELCHEDDKDQLRVWIAMMIAVGNLVHDMWRVAARVGLHPIARRPPLRVACLQLIDPEGRFKMAT